MKKIIFILFLVASSFAKADAPISNGFQSHGFYGSTRAGVALVACKAQWPNTTSVVFSGDQGFGQHVYSCQPSGNSRFTSPSSYCQWSSSPPDLSKPLAQQCPPEPIVCTPGREFSAEVPMGTVSAPDMDYPINIKGCRVSVTEFQGCHSNPATGALQCKFRLKEHEPAPIGEAQTPLATPFPSPKSEEIPPHNPAQGQGCPAGTKSLGIDSTGGTICGGSGTSPTTPAKTETKTNTPPVTNADGSTTKTDITTRVNSDGSTTTTTKTTTTGTDGKVTTNESAVTGAKPSGSGGADGGAGKDDTSDEKKDDFCIKNPQLNICKNSEVTGGGCSGSTDSTACTGDAITCAILRQQKKEYCENTATSPMKTLGEQMLAGMDPLKGTFPTKENARVVNVPSLNQNGFLGGGACFSDFQFSVSGMSFAIPFSKLCDYLIALRGLVMLLAALASWRLVSKSILG